jgi:hypothetical protein
MPIQAREREGSYHDKIVMVLSKKQGTSESAHSPIDFVQETGSGVT